MTGRGPYAEFEANLLAFQRLGRGRPWSEVHDETDVSWNISRLPWARARARGR